MTTGLFAYCTICVLHSCCFYQRPVLIATVLTQYSDRPDERGRFSLYEPVEFIRHFLMDRLEWRKVGRLARPASLTARALLWLAHQRRVTCVRACAGRCGLHLEMLPSWLDNSFFITRCRTAVCLCAVHVQGQESHGSTKSGPVCFQLPPATSLHTNSGTDPGAQVRDSVAIHVPCSSKKMGVADAFQMVASKCAHEVTNTGVPCCGVHPAHSVTP